MRNTRLPQTFLQDQFRLRSQPSLWKRYGFGFVAVLVAGSIFWLQGGLADKTVAQQPEVWSAALESVQTEPERQLRVGLQAGHWEASQLPAELRALSWNFGTSAGGFNEWEISLATAQQTAVILRERGVAVDILPATIPPGYKADAFVSFHADGNEDTSISGYKVVASEWDTDGRASRLAEALSAAYGAVVSLEEDTAVTDDMTKYYAFNYHRFKHAIAPETPGAIMELGFLTNATDRRVITQKSAEISQAIAEGIWTYLQSLEK